MFSLFLTLKALNLAIERKLTTKKRKRGGRKEEGSTKVKMAELKRESKMDLSRIQAQVQAMKNMIVERDAEFNKMEALKDRYPEDYAQCKQERDSIVKALQDRIDQEEALIEDSELCDLCETITEAVPHLKDDGDQLRRAGKDLLLQIKAILDDEEITQEQKELLVKLRYH